MVATLPQMSLAEYVADLIRGHTLNAEDRAKLHEAITACTPPRERDTREDEDAVENTRTQVHRDAVPAGYPVIIRVVDDQVDFASELLFSFGTEFFPHGVIVIPMSATAQWIGPAS